jgi:hypothetical protein
LPQFLCSYLKSKVDVSEERLSHIATNHPDLLPDNMAVLIETIKEPEFVRVSNRMPKAKILYRWFDNLLGGKYVAAVVMSETGESSRNWLMTAYITRSLPKGDFEWRKN